MDYLFVVVSNREPYIHVFSGNQIQCMMPASGLTVALDPVMRACGGTWVAYSSGNADRSVVDKIQSCNGILLNGFRSAYLLGVII